MFAQASVILSTIGLMATLSLLILVTVPSVRILLECFLGEFTVKKVVSLAAMQYVPFCPENIWIIYYGRDIDNDSKIYN